MRAGLRLLAVEPARRHGVSLLPPRAGVRALLSRAPNTPGSGPDEQQVGKAPKEHEDGTEVANDRTNGGVRGVSAAAAAAVVAAAAGAGRSLLQSIPPLMSRASGGAHVSSSSSADRPLTVTAPQQEAASMATAVATSNTEQMSTPARRLPRLLAGLPFIGRATTRAASVEENTAEEDDADEEADTDRGSDASAARNTNALFDGISLLRDAVREINEVTKVTGADWNWSVDRFAIALLTAGLQQQGSVSDVDEVRSKRADLPVHDGCDGFTEDQLTYLRYASNLCFAAYGRTKDKFAERAQLQPERLQIVEEHGSKGNDSSEALLPRWFLAIDHGTKEVLVTIRGTMDLRDFVRNLACRPEPFVGPHGEEGFGHMGCVRAAEALEAELVPSLARVHKLFPHYKSVCLTGHSIGGGIAALTAILLRRRFADSQPDLQVHAVTFGPAACASANIAVSCADTVLSVVNADDVVPRLSIHALERLRRSAAENKYQFDTILETVGEATGLPRHLSRFGLDVQQFQQVVRRVRGIGFPYAARTASELHSTNGLGYNARDQQQALPATPAEHAAPQAGALPAQMNEDLLLRVPLYPPGTIYQLGARAGSAGADGAVSAFRTDPTSFDRIVVSSRLLLDHPVRAYRRTLEQLKPRAATESHNIDSR